jgi:hypothetical protein
LTISTRRFISYKSKISSRRMSLIPSESLSFPDDFSRAVSRARVLHERQRHARKTEPATAAAPKEPAASRIQQSVKPAPAKENVSAPTPKLIPRKPMIRNISAPSVAIQSNTRPAGPKKFAPVRLPKPMRVPPDVVVDLAKEAKPPAPIAVAAAVNQPNEKEQVLSAPALPRRRSRKLRRFLKIEIPAVIVLAACAWAGLTHQFGNPLAITILNYVTIAVACVVAITPIALFAATPTLPRSER